MPNTLAYGNQERDQLPVSNMLCVRGAGQFMGRLKAAWRLPGRCGLRFFGSGICQAPPALTVACSTKIRLFGASLYSYCPLTPPATFRPILRPLRRYQAAAKRVSVCAACSSLHRNHTTYVLVVIITLHLGTCVCMRAAFGHSFSSLRSSD